LRVGVQGKPLRAGGLRLGVPPVDKRCGEVKFSLCLGSHAEVRNELGAQPAGYLLRGVSGVQVMQQRPDKAVVLVKGCWHVNTERIPAGQVRTKLL
jgi:hypothetical protein